MTWVIVDGDRMADLFDRAAAAGDVGAFLQVAQGVDADRAKWVDWVGDSGGHVVFEAADSVVARFDGEVANFPEDEGAGLRYAWSGGVGASFAMAHAALAVAKASGRGRFVRMHSEAETLRVV